MFNSFYNLHISDQLHNGWTNLNPLDPIIPQDNIDPREELPFDESELDLQQLDPITESNNLDPVRTDINGPPRPRLEDDDSWFSPSQRKPWLPDLTQDIQPFDDLFGNDVGYADARTGTGSTSRASSFILISFLSVIFLLWA